MAQEFLAVAGGVAFAAATIAALAGVHASGRRGGIGIGFSLIAIADRIAGRPAPRVVIAALSAASVALGLAALMLSA